MIDYAVDYVSDAFAWIVLQVDKIFGSVSGAIPLILGMFAMYLSARLLLRPLFGMSDGVLKKVKRNNKEGDSVDG